MSSSLFTSFNFLSSSYNSLLFLSYSLNTSFTSHASLPFLLSCLTFFSFPFLKWFSSSCFHFSFLFHLLHHFHTCCPVMSHFPSFYFRSCSHALLPLLYFYHISLPFLSIPPPPPNYHISTHSESNKTIDTDDVWAEWYASLVWKRGGEGERGSVCSVQLEGAFSERFCPFREYDITHREFPAACIFGHNVPGEHGRPQETLRIRASSGEEHFNVTSTRLATCTLQIHTGFDEQTDGWDTMQCILGDGILSWNQYTALWVRVWNMPRLSFSLVILLKFLSTFLLFW